MKKYLSLLLALALALSMAACAVPKEDGNTGDGGVQQGNSTEPDTAAAAPEAVPEQDEGDVHSPAPAEADNILPHDPEGYCGNTVTTVKFDGRGPNGPEEKWEKSFWGDESVRMTDLLRFLDYSEGVCRCLPEYTVDTEFGEGYGINLSESYVRHDGHQVTLTEEQTAELREIIEWAKEQD